MLAQPKKGGTQKGFAYHEEDNYYQIGQEQGGFYGKIANELGFTQLDREALFNALEGNNAQGRRMVKTREDGVDKKGYRKNAYTDLTFMADKSISVAYELALRQDMTLAQKLASSHQLAVRRTLDFIEKEYTYSRTDLKAQNKALFLLYDHFDARLANGQLDPSLHTHALMVNITQNVNGSYNKLENFHIAKDHKMLGMLYRNELAHILQSQGLEIEVCDSKQGFFQLKGFEKEQRQEFSQRSKIINEWVVENEERIRKEQPNITAKKLRDIAQKKTRGWKEKNVDKAAFVKQNEDRAQRVNYCLPKHHHTFKPKIDAKTILNLAINDKLETHSIMSKQDILNHAAKISLGSVSSNDLIAAFTHNTNLICNKDNQFTTQEIIDKEHFIFSQSNANTFVITNNKAQINNAVAAFEEDKGFKLKQAQNTLAHTILSTNSRYVIAQGVAGSGKSTSLEIVRNVCYAQGIQIIAIAPTGTATDNLAQEANIKESFTVAKFIQMQGFGIKNAVIIIDEAGMLGTRDTYALMHIAKENNLKLVFSGDQNQKKSIAQGDIFSAMQTKGFNTVNLDEGNRQKSDLMRRAVKQLLSRDISGAIETLKDTTQEFINNDERLSYAQELYLQDIKNSLLITTTNQDRKALNESIRSVLVSQNKIVDSREFQTREIQSLCALEKRQAVSYTIGDSVFLSQNIGSITSGKEAKITNVDLENNCITIQHKNFKHIVHLLYEGHKLNYYKEIKQQFGVGEQIICKKNDKKTGLKNGQIGTIVSIHNKTITAIINNKKINFNTQEYPYIQHAYAITDFASQGKTTNRVIAVTNANATSFNDFYTQITRAKYEAHIITDDLVKLKERAVQDSIKLNARDIILHKIIHTTKEVLRNGEGIKRTFRDALRSATEKFADFKRNFTTLKSAQREPNTTKEHLKEDMKMTTKDIVVNLTKDVQLKVNPKELMDIFALCQACAKNEITFSNIVGKIASKLELPEAEMFKSTADLVSTAVKSGVEVLKNDTIKTLGEKVQEVISIAQTASSKL